MPDFTQDTVDKCVKRLERYRVMAAQSLAAEGEPDEFSGALLLSLGLRESTLLNINNPAETDHGCFQINERWHAEWLDSEPGCKAGTWTVEPGHKAIENGYCPRFTPACLYSLKLLKLGASYAKNKTDADPLRFALAAYNAGIGGALDGHREGDVDKYTTGGDYSAWVIRHRTKVNKFLTAHPNWRL